MKKVLSQLFDGKSLARSEAARAMELILSGETPPEQIGAFLGALRAKRETVDEITGFAQTLRSKARPVPSVSRLTVDTCGTGGDGAETFNISTCVAFVVAGAGVPVAKHGNRSVSSRCGSADVLETLKVKIELEPDEAARSLSSTGFAFFYAPSYHPTMRVVGPVRRSLGVRTVFNLLGPLLNPANVRRQVVGVYDSKLLRVMAEVLRELGTEEAMVVAGSDGLDEFTLSGPTRVVHLKSGKFSEYSVSPEDAGLASADLSELRGGDAATNARILESVLRGSVRGPARDVVLYNAAAALMVAGQASDFKEGVHKAEASLLDGRAIAVLEKVRKL